MRAERKIVMERNFFSFLTKKGELFRALYGNISEFIKNRKMGIDKKTICLYNSICLKEITEKGVNDDDYSCLRTLRL
jgi:hypothetical protein